MRLFAVPLATAMAVYVVVNPLQLSAQEPEPAPTEAVSDTPDEVTDAEREEFDAKPVKPKAEAAPVNIQLTDYEGNYEFLTGELVGPGDGAPCDYTIVLSAEQVDDLRKAGKTSAVVPALCTTVFFAFSQSVNQPTADSKPLEGQVDFEKVVKDYQMSLQLDGDTYRSTSLRLVVGSSGLPPAPGASDSSDRTVPIVVTLGALLLLLAAAVVFGNRGLRRTRS